MIATKYIRNGKTITEVGTNKATQFGSINKAKKASREMQLKSGGLGRGSLVAMPPKDKSRKSPLVYGGFRPHNNPGLFSRKVG